jgi:uroporphyrinogen-III synthase
MRRMSDCCVAVPGQVTPAGLSHNPGGPLQRNRPTLLLTRPEAASSRFLQDFRATLGSDWPAVIAPLMQTRFFDAAIPDCANIVFTSETAVRAVERLSAGRRPLAWCVGPRTQAAARDAGFLTRSGPGNAQDLADVIIAAKAEGAFFCPAAPDQAFEMAQKLKWAGIETIEAILYAQEACPPNAEAVALLGASGRVLLPLFSARSARLASAAFVGHTAPLFVAAISDQVASDARALGPERMVVAQTPDAPALIAAIASLTDLSEAG